MLLLLLPPLHKICVTYLRYLRIDVELHVFVREMNVEQFVMVV